jgi:hypothetical protein
MAKWGTPGSEPLSGIQVKDGTRLLPEAKPKLNNILIFFCFEIKKNFKFCAQSINLDYVYQNYALFLITRVD